MINVDVLTKAIAAHSNWKARLRTATNSGKSDVSPAQARVDNQCEFGKWVYGSDLTASDKLTDHYKAVKQLHAQFHQEAAKVLDWATSGKKDAAEQALAVGGSCAKVASELTQAILKWRDSIH